MEPYREPAYALLRMVTGFLFLWHGTQKLFEFPAPPPPYSPFVISVAGTINLAGGSLVMIGLCTSWAAFVCSGLMAVAYWMVFGWRALLPIVNGGELDVLYCFVFLYIAAKGGGIWSLEALLARVPSASRWGRSPSP
ncbi:DoxX family protein [Candidatus Nitrospira bockiana]